MSRLAARAALRAACFPAYKPEACVPAYWDFWKAQEMEVSLSYV